VRGQTERSAGESSERAGGEVKPDIVERHNESGMRSAGGHGGWAFCRTTIQVRSAKFSREMNFEMRGPGEGELQQTGPVFAARRRGKRSAATESITWFPE